MNDEHGAFEIGRDGLVVTHPLTGWTVASVDSVAIICRLEYVETQEELRAGSPRKLQLVMSTEQARELVGTLLRHVDRQEQRISSLPLV